MSYKKTLGQRILDKLEEVFPKGMFKAYFYGDNIEIPDTLLPCVIIDKLDGEVSHGATGTDEREHRYQVKVLVNKKDEFGKDPFESPGQSFLENTIEGVDETTGEFSTQSVLGVLRKYFTLDGTITNQEIVIRYGVRPRGENLVTLEGHVTFTAQELLTVSSRQ